MKIKVIKTEKEYNSALARAYELMDARRGTSEGDELELLSTLIHVYEEKAFPVDLPDPREAIRFRMEQRGMKPQGLVPYLGSRSRVSEVLSGQRTLSLKMIRNLTTGLGIPASVLIREPKPSHKSRWSGIGDRRLRLSGTVSRKWLHSFQGSPSQAKKRPKLRSTQATA